MIHELKVWSEYFSAILADAKPFEVRKDDRGFAVDDTLILREWDPDREEYTGYRAVRVVTYKLDGGQFGIEPGYCVLGLAPEPQP